MRTLTLAWLSVAFGSAFAFSPGRSPAVRSSQSSVVRRLVPLESSLMKNALYAGNVLITKWHGVVAML